MGVRRTAAVLVLLAALLPAAAANQAPVAEFSGPDTVRVDEVATFNASAAHDPDGEIVSYKWSVNNSTAEVLQVRFTQPGEFRVTLNVRDDDGAVTHRSETVEVVENRDPDVTVRANATRVEAGEPVRFTADAVDLDGRVTGYDWSTGASGASTVERFSQPGKTMVGVRVTDDQGAIGYDSVLVEVVDDRPAINDSAPATTTVTGFASRVDPDLVALASVVLGALIAALIAAVYVRVSGPPEDLVPEEPEE